MVAGLLPILHRLWRRERPDFQSTTVLFMALGFLMLQVRSQRIVEYYPAFAVLLAAWSWSHLGLPLPARLASPRPRWQPVLLGLGMVLLLVWLGTTAGRARRDTDGAGAAARLDSYRDAALWLVANSPPRSLVFNTDWDDFPQLFFWNSHNIYITGLDPTYMSLYDLELYRLWRAVGGGSHPEPSQPIRERFGAQYVMSDVQHRRFLERAAADSGLEEVFRSPSAIVFRVRPAPLGSQ
jgi:hypothetical protein